MNQCCLKLNLQGTYKELMDSEGAFAEFINEHSTSQGDDSEETGVKEKTIDQVSGLFTIYNMLGYRRDRGNKIEL